MLVVFDATEGAFGCVYVANTGAPFTADDFRAICEIAQSSKRPGQGIGNKGVGFKSVLQIAAWPEIYSKSAASSASRAPVARPHRGRATARQCSRATSRFE